MDLKTIKLSALTFALPLTLIACGDDDAQTESDDAVNNNTESTEDSAELDMTDEERDRLTQTVLMYDENAPEGGNEATMALQAMIDSMPMSRNALLEELRQGDTYSTEALQHAFDTVDADWQEIANQTALMYQTEYTMDEEMIRSTMLDSESSMGGFEEVEVDAAIESLDPANYSPDLESEVDVEDSQE